jgi:peptide-methionine (S)-S-oxide reductase
MSGIRNMENLKKSIVVLGGGCFWCVEAVLQRLKGVSEVVPGYAGGKVPGTPTYREVCSGLTGHAEVVRVVFDTQLVSYETILEVFLTTHDPTTLNRQGADVGTQYRSVIFYSSPKEEKNAAAVIHKLSPLFSTPIVTTLEPFVQFFKAESEHSDYYNNHSNQGYCQVVINPKIAKLKALYKTLLKDS